MNTNWSTLYRLLMDGGRFSEKHVQKVKAQFELADDDGKAALIKRYQHGAKAKSQNKAVVSNDAKIPKRARKDDGTFRGDDPSTPDVDEAYDPPKKVTKKSPKKKAPKKGLFGRNKKG